MIDRVVEMEATYGLRWNRHEFINSCDEFA
jgi:hypothetical protein